MSGPGARRAARDEPERLVEPRGPARADRHAPAQPETWVFMTPTRYRARAVAFALLGGLALVPAIPLDLFDRLLLAAALGLMAWASLRAARNARVSVDLFQGGTQGPDLIYRQAHRAVPLRRAEVRAVRVCRSVVAPWSDLSFELAVEIGGRPYDLLLSSPFWRGGAVMGQARRLATWAGVPLDDATGARWATSRWRLRRWMAAGEHWKATLYLVGLGVCTAGVLVALWTWLTGSPPPHQ